MSFLKLFFDEDYNPDSSLIRLCLPTIVNGVDSIYMMTEADNGLEKEYHDLVRRYNGISQMYEDAFIIHFDDLEYHIDIFIDSILNIADPKFDMECYGKEEIEMNKEILRDSVGRINGCTAQYKVTKRIGNNVLYFGVLELYEKKCMICNTSIDSLVDVCHIKPWSESENVMYERTDECNGIILCKNHHSLFDAGFFTVDENNKVLLSNKLSDSEKKLLFGEFNSYVNLRSSSQYYLKFHRDNIYQK